MFDTNKEGLYCSVMFCIPIVYNGFVQIRIYEMINTIQTFCFIVKEPLSELYIRAKWWESNMSS